MGFGLQHIGHLLAKAGEKEMKNKYDEIKSVPAFREFMKDFERTANYFAAKSGADAVDLCIAYAFEAGMDWEELLMKSKAVKS